MLIKLNEFSGMAPRVDPHLLPEQMGTEAINCKIVSGNLKSWKVPLTVATPTKVGTKKSIFLYESKWLTWTTDVNAVRSPIANDLYNRLYWTGDGGPKVASETAITSGGTDYPNSSFDLGIPAPALAPALTVNLRWANKVLPSSSQWVASAFGNGIHVAIGYGGTAAATSPDGITWTARTLPSSTGWACLGYGAGLFVAGSASNTDKVATSPDGITWTLRALPSNYDVNSVCFANGIFVAIVNAGALTSPDGITWAYHALPSSATNYSLVAYGSGVFLAISGGLGDVAATSPDGVTWTQRALPKIDTWGCAAFGNNLFVAISYGGRTVARSADGIVWDVSYTPTAQLWRSIAFGYGTFVAVALDYSKIAVSADGIAWEERPIATASRWASICFGAGNFVAVSGGPGTASTVSGLMPSLDLLSAESRSYVYRYLSSYGEAGPPSPASTVVTVYPGETVSLSAIDPPAYSAASTYTVGAIVMHSGSPYECITAITVAEAWNAAKWKLKILTHSEIFRTNTGSAGTTAYQFVASIAIGTTTYTDSIASEDLGDVLDSTLWDAPPSDLAGLIGLPNGSLCGFSGNEVCFSVPYQPHAWPANQRYPLVDNVIGLGAYGLSVLVMTDGPPYTIAVGDDLTVLRPDKSENGYACVSKRGIVDMGYAIAYPSTSGLVVSGVNGSEMPTAKILDKDSWVALSPSTSFACYYGGLYLSFRDNAAFTFDPEGNLVTISGVDATAAFHDPATGDLYLAIGANIAKWDAGATYLSYGWTSKPFIALRPINLSCAQVLGSSYGTFFKLYVDGTLQATVTVTDDKPFRLPAGFRGREFKVRVEGNAQTIYQVLAAESMDELRRA